MPFSVIDKGSKYFTAKTYTGTGATQSISGLEFSPDWVWIKQRSGVTWHNLYDVLRGTTKALASNDTGADDTRATGLTAFTSDGFTLGTDNNANGSSNTYVSWCWDANGAGVSNTAGSITSTVSANTTSGFSIVSYTGNGTNNATVGHGLGVTPAMLIVKNRDVADGWGVWNKGLGSATQQMQLNGSGAVFTDDIFNAVSSTTVTLGTDTWSNTSTKNYIMYCWSEVKGYSKFGSYTGNGSSDGTFIYTGFKPAFIMVKQTNAAGEYWEITDSTRGTYNLNTPLLYANTSSAEGSATRYDYLSNGFKCRQTNVGSNQSGSTYIYMCFASNPFVSSKGVCVTAR
jgi:hypothetical protein